MRFMLSAPSRVLPKRFSARFRLTTALLDGLVTVVDIEFFFVRAISGYHRVSGGAVLT